MQDDLSFLPAVEPLNTRELAAAQAELDAKTKPLGSLGVLESLAARYVAIRGRRNLRPPRCEVVVIAADHGIAAAGVSAFPQVVTAQMLANFARGGAAINALCRAAGAELSVVNVGVLGDTPPGVLDARIRESSRDFRAATALDPQDVTAALRVGLRLAAELAARDVDVVALGEMGIANSTVAAALASAFTRESVHLMVGRGTGVDDEGLAHKRAVVTQALAFHAPDPAQPLRVLEQLGGLEIIALAGLAIGAASARRAVVLDGFISSTAGLVACKLCPAVSEYLFASHLSVEPGHAHVLTALGLEPLLRLDLRLGEGSGAALALPLFHAASRIVLEMATFASAEVATREG